MAERVREPRPGAALAIALGGLFLCLVVFALAPHDRLLDPLTFVLAAAALAANAADVHYEGSLWVSGAFVCYLMAAAVLGPAPAVAIAVFAEAIDAVARRFRVVAGATNVLGAVGPTLVAALALTPLHVRDSASPELFAGAVTGAALSALALNTSALSLLTAISDGRSVWTNLHAARRLWPVLVLDVVLTVLVALAYREFGFAVSAFAVATVLTASYTLKLIVTSRERTREVADLAQSRGRLVTQALDAEERERRVLAEQLHDHAVQSLLAARQELDDAQRGDLESLARAHTAIERTVKELRDTVFDLHPSVLDHAGLAAALDSAAERYAGRLGCKPQIAVDPDATGIRDELLFSLGRELLTNAGTHAQASVVVLRITRLDRGQLDDSIVLEVTDDGIGFDDARRADGGGGEKKKKSKIRKSARGWDTDTRENSSRCDRV